MTSKGFFIAVLMAFLLLAGCVGGHKPMTAATAADQTTPMANSLYQITPELIDQNNQSRRFDQFRGHPTLVAMFYSSCSYACPLLIAKLLSIDYQLTPPARRQMRYLLVSLDAERDTPVALKKMAKNYQLDEERFSLLHADENDVRLIATLLGVAYRKLENGEFSHSTPLTLVDRNGVVILQTDSQKETSDEQIATMNQAATQ